jgi:hypothetical protein
MASIIDFEAQLLAKEVKHSFPEGRPNYSSTAVDIHMADLNELTEALLAKHCLTEVRLFSTPVYVFDYFGIEIIVSRNLDRQTGSLPTDFCICVDKHMDEYCDAESSDEAFLEAVAQAWAMGIVS